MNFTETLPVLILKGTHLAYCFAHLLQLTLVVVAKKHSNVDNIFKILNIAGGSIKRKEMIRQKTNGITSAW
uniref:Putative ovule protein n=1 Tax=Solanum chacoense TaxID=4108 RepID=A0A0V0H0G1_SOLCH